jgi:two-component system, chemotaxis family, protein-glutamate methylesterase/glutaminase
MTGFLPSPRKPRIEAVVLGASAGGLHALLQLLANLPKSFRLPLIAVLHLPDNRESQLPEIFRQRLSITVSEAVEKETIAPATLYFAGPGYHLSIESDRTFSLSCEEPVHYSRPSIDVLMESAADAYGAGLAGILLTGANSDGAEGLAKIKSRGGLTIVQDPAEAEAATMPQAGIRRLLPDYVLRLNGIRSLLLELDGASC